MPALAPLSDTRVQDRQWYVARTKARKEDYAVQQLERRGVAVFLPRILEWGRDEVAPLFPGYLFLHIALLEHYYRVVWTPGVRSFVAFGATPTPIQERDLVHRRQCGRRGCHPTARAVQGGGSGADQERPARGVDRGRAAALLRARTG